MNHTSSVNYSFLNHRIFKTLAAPTYFFGVIFLLSLWAISKESFKGQDLNILFAMVWVGTILSNLLLMCFAETKLEKLTTLAFLFITYFLSSWLTGFGITDLINFFHVI